MSIDWPELLRRLRALKYRVNRVGQKTVAGFELYLVDLSEWKLSLDWTPIIWVKVETAECLSAPELAESLQEVTRERGWRHRERIVLLDGDGRELKAHTAGQYFPCLVIVDATDQRNILAAPSLQSALLDLICAQVPLSYLAPYEIGDTVEGTRFFGRRYELDRILSHPNTNFAITGARRIGKTSLLKEVRRRLLDQGEDSARIVWLSGQILHNPQQFVEELVRQLNPRELPHLEQAGRHLFFLPDFLRRMSKVRNGRITIFLDEANDFLRWAREEQDLLPTIRASTQADHCRYIVNGFQTLMNELDNKQSPFFMAFESLHLGPFDRKDTKDIVVHPMRSLRVHFEDEEEVVARIHADTGGHPALIQVCCLELIHQIERWGSCTLSPASLVIIYANHVFRAQTVKVFMDDVSAEDKMLVYALLLSFPESKETFTQAEIYEALQKQSCPYSPEQIDQTCDRLVLANVLRREGLRYQFAISIFPRIMRTDYNISYLLSIAKKDRGL